MISKICTGHHFYGALRYICQALKQAEILAVEGVRSYDLKLMIKDFERQHSLRPEKNQACFHGILSFYPGEKPPGSQILEIARKYLEGLNIRNTQYAIVKHTDKAHLHVHLIANMVNNEGKSISDRWVALRGKKLAQKLTLEYKLTQGLSKDLSITQYQNLCEPEQQLYKIYGAIRHNLRSCRSMDELQERLRILGIEMQFKYKGQTNERQGVSFRLGEYCFKGSTIDRQFSYGNLERTLSLQQKQTLTLRYEHGPQKKLSRSAHLNPEHAGSIGRVVTKEMEKTLELLFRQEQALEGMPNELTQATERKRTRKKRIRRQNEH
jgi:Relaxase/Mobilisation nuclease domain